MPLFYNNPTYFTNPCIFMGKKAEPPSPFFQKFGKFNPRPLYKGGEVQVKMLFQASSFLIFVLNRLLCHTFFISNKGWGIVLKVGYDFAQYLLFRPVSNMKDVFNFIISCISLQLLHCKESFLPYFIKRVIKGKVK